ncbi:MAG: hypothetical protein LBC02_14445 [Planctomycetaceae bacterium]|jgi:hypothetical protein|nr:hypothetical protein [Planctomycetaceae bacterium]
MMKQFAFWQNQKIRIAILLFCFAIFNYVYVKHNFSDSNSIVRLALSLCLWEDGSVIIDKYHQFTIDFAYRDGHYYSCNAPGISFIVLPAVSVTHTILQQLGRTDHLVEFDPIHTWEPNTNFKLFILSGSVIVSFLCAGAIAVLYLFFRCLGVVHKTSVLFAIVLGFGTPFACFATTMYGHSLAASFLIFGLVLGFPAKKQSIFCYIVTGLILAYTVWIEYTAAISVIVLELLFLSEMKRQGLSGKQIGWNTLLMVLGTAPVAVGFFVYNTLTFGSPFQVGYNFVSTNFPQMDEGFYGIRLPVFSTFIGSLFGLQDGIVWRSPILILSPFFIIYNIWKNQFRTLNMVCFIILVYYFLLNSAYAYPDVRHITASLPFLIIPIGLAWDSLGFRLKIFVSILLIVSLIIGFVSMNVPQSTELMQVPIRILFIFREFFAGHVRNLLFYVGVNAYLSLGILLLVWILAGCFFGKDAFRGQTV